MAPEVPVIVEVTVSVPVKVTEAPIAKVALNVPVPLVNVELDGNVALEPVDVKCTVPE
jgi:hypothetical protein